MKLSRMSVIAAVLGVAYAGPLFAADAAARDQMRAERERIQADAKAARDACKGMKGNERQVCMAEAKGKERLAKAEFALKQKDTPKNRYEVAAAKAEMEYDIAKEKCDDMKGKEKGACQTAAKDARDNAKKQAEAQRDAAEPAKEAKAKKDS